ncbi:hypothetical protein BESB_048440 [Besnoitia besnoiti]|uniref:Uncharacterized protein n=1 Tax=Besnoitia besnoiti TaxID=94643 RepID=A0A2A9MMA8_BESBE|nr:hypothetical protein BESB_048440 [Besnoitia besnoiti]PFH36652.1 hypothetical protein BESB_048440 [Besnoitia besnoiti]
MASPTSSPPRLIALAATKQWPMVVMRLDELVSSVCIPNVPSTGSTEEAPAPRRLLAAAERQELEETDKATGNTLAHFAAVAGAVDVLERLLKLTLESPRSHVAEANGNAAEKPTGVLRAKNCSNRTPLSLLEFEMTQLKAKLEDCLEEEASDAEKAMKLQQKIDAMESAKTWLLSNCYSAAERLFYGDGSYEDMVRELGADPTGLFERLECYNDMPYPFLCVEENDRQKIAWIASQNLVSPPTLAGAGGVSPLELRDDHGNTLLHLVHFEVDLGSGFSDDESEDEDEPPRKGQDVKGRAAGDADSGKREDETAASSGEATGEADGKTQKGKALPLISETLLKALTGSDKETLQTLQLLLSYPAVKNFVNTPNRTGQTPAHFIVEDAPTGDAAHAALILLVNAGADLNVKDESGRTPFMALCEAHGDGPWVSWALKPAHEGGGVDASLKDDKGRTYREYIEMGEEADSWEEDEEEEDED